jgi:MFS family permease
VVWVLGANVLLGANQGLAWSMTVIMKIDLAGPDERGLATGLNEFAGYGGLALVALLTGLAANTWGLRPEPFYIGVALAVLGLGLSLLVKDTTPQADQDRQAEGPAAGDGPELGTVFRQTSLSNPTLSASSLGGLATNLKDGMLWGLLPLVLAAGLGVDRTGIVVATYPAVWGVSQLVFGPLSDRWGRTVLILPGLAAQAIGVAGFLWATGYLGFLAAAVVTGLGTGMVYPTLLALVSDASGPAWRSSALGIYRFWRDLGYAAGALGSAAIADLLDCRLCLGLALVSLER